MNESPDSLSVPHDSAQKLPKHVVALSKIRGFGACGNAMGKDEFIDMVGGSSNESAKLREVLMAAGIRTGARPLKILDGILAGKRKNSEAPANQSLPSVSPLSRITTASPRTPLLDAVYSAKSDGRSSPISMLSADANGSDIAEFSAAKENQVIEESDEEDDTLDGFLPFGPMLAFDPLTNKFTIPTSCGFAIELEGSEIYNPTTMIDFAKDYCSTFRSVVKNIANAHIAKTRIEVEKRSKRAQETEDTQAESDAASPGYVPSDESLWDGQSRTSVSGSENSVSQKTRTRPSRNRSHAASRDPASYTPSQTQSGRLVKKTVPEIVGHIPHLKKKLFRVKLQGIVETKDEKDLDPALVDAYCKKNGIDLDSEALTLRANSRCGRRTRKRSRTQTPESSTPVAGRTESGEELFMVEDIRGKREENGILEYLIKWHCYGDDENTWEPASKLASQCPEVVAKFEQSLVDQPSGPKV